jgi:hypothetical protein
MILNNLHTAPYTRLDAFACDIIVKHVYEYKEEYVNRMQAL